MAEKNCPIKVFYSIFFTPPRWADAAFVRRRPARLRGRPAKPHTSAQRAPRRGANGCANVRYLTCAVVQPSTLRPQAALGSGFSLQAAFWYQNAMLARVVADCAASRRLFMLRIKKSSLIRFVAPPFQNANSSFCARIFAMLAGSTPSAWAAPVQTSHVLRHCPLLAFAAVLSHVEADISPFPHHVNRFIASKQP